MHVSLCLSGKKKKWTTKTLSTQRIIPLRVPLHLCREKDLMVNEKNEYNTPSKKYNAFALTLQLKCIVYRFDCKPTHLPKPIYHFNQTQMKNNQQRVATNSISFLFKSEETPKEFVYHMPPGTKFSDILMDVQEVCQELHMSKRKVYNLRRAGILSFTSLSSDGKVYFFRQEIAAMLEANTVIGENSLMKKLGISGWLTGFTSFLSFFDF